MEVQLNGDKLPEIKIDAVTEFVNNLAASAPGLLIEFISETFDLLRPPNSE